MVRHLKGRYAEIIHSSKIHFLQNLFPFLEGRGGGTYTDIQTGPDQVLGQNHAISNSFES